MGPRSPASRRVVSEQVLSIPSFCFLSCKWMWCLSLLPAQRQRCLHRPSARSRFPQGAEVSLRPPVCPITPLSLPSSVCHHVASTLPSPSVPASWPGHPGPELCGPQHPHCPSPPTQADSLLLQPVSSPVFPTAVNSPHCADYKLAVLLTSFLFSPLCLIHQRILVALCKTTVSSDLTVSTFLPSLGPGHRPGCLPSPKKWPTPSLAPKMWAFHATPLSSGIPLASKVPLVWLPAPPWPVSPLLLPSRTGACLATQHTRWLPQDLCTGCSFPPRQLSDSLLRFLQISVKMSPLHTASPTQPE